MPGQIAIGVDTATGEIVLLPAEARDLSVYIIGKAGVGKSKLLEHIAFQDMKNGDGLLFLDPHADSAELLLHHIPRGREGDVIWWDPTDRQRPFGLNPFW